MQTGTRTGFLLRPYNKPPWWGVCVHEVKRDFKANENEVDGSRDWILDYDFFIFLTDTITRVFNYENKVTVEKNASH